MRRRRRTASVVGALVGALAAMSCGIDAPQLDVPDQPRPDLGAPTQPGGDMDPEMGLLGSGAGAGTMSGTWLLVHENSSCVLGNEQVTLADYLVEIDQRGRSLVERRRICALELSPVLGLRLGVPEAAFSSVVFPQVDRGVITGLAPGGGYTSSTELALWGLELEEPWGEELPTDDEDPQVIDADDDGHPGVTFEIGQGTCDRYTVQRQLIRYQGLLTEPNRVEGSSVTFTESRALGGTSSICRIAPPVRSNDALSSFVMVRVDGQGGAFDADVDADGEITCPEVRQLGVLLNPGREPEPTHCQ